MNRHIRLFALTAVLMLTISGAAVRSAVAETSDSVSVTASIGITPSLSITVCDETANFGSGLTNTGAAPTGADSGVFATVQGTGIGEGVFYVWSSQCAAPINISANVDFFYQYCGTENTGTGASPDVTLTGQDLRLQDFGTASNQYFGWQMILHVPECSAMVTPHVEPVGSGDYIWPLYLGLRIDDGDDPGNFSSVITFSLAPQ